MGKRREWMAVVGLLVAGGALLAWGTWRAPLADVDEPRFAGASRHMLASGDWLHTYFNGEPRWQKPILFYWLQAGSFAAFGVSEFAARLPAWLFATLSGLLLYAFARRFCGHPAGLFALVAWFSLPQTHIWAKLGIVDTTLTFLTTAAALAAFAGAERGARRGLWYIAAGAAMGLAALTKGPVGLAIPAGVYLCYVLLEPRARRELLSPWPYVALATALAAAAPWYVLQYCDYGAVYLEEFFGQENIERFGGGARGAGIPGIIWWLFVFLVCAFPCSALLPWAAGSTVGGSVPDDGRSRRLGKFLTIWVALVLIVWSLSAARHPQYIMAIYPPVALLCGRFLSDRWYARPRGGLAPGIAAAVCGSLVAAGLAYGSLRFLGQVREFTPTQQHFFTGMGLLLAAAYLVGGLTCVLWWRTGDGRGGVVSVVLAGLAVSLLSADVILPGVVAAKDAPLWRVAVTCRGLLGPEDELIDCDVDSSLLVYYAEHVSVNVDPDRLEGYLEAIPRRGIAYVVARRESEKHVRRAGLSRIAQLGRYAVWRTAP